MLLFWLAALLLCALAILFILLPLRRGAGEDDRARINVELYEDRLAELEAALRNGEVASDEFETLKAELQKNLLIETSAQQADSPAASTPSRLPLAVAVSTPVLAILLYVYWGSIADVELAETFRQLDPSDAVAVESAVETLASRMERQPDNDQGWFLLANALLGLEKYGRAADAFARLLERYPEDARLASNHAEAMYLAAGGTLTPAVQQAVERALALNPHSLSMLEILGMDAFQRGDFQQALDHFQQALNGGAQGDRAQAISRAIAAVRMMMADQGIEEESEPAVDEPARRTIRVSLSAGEDVNVAPDATVFVFARAVGGPPMPLAVQRLAFAQLPVEVVLDESMAMMQGFGLANFDTVEVVARVTDDGTPGGAAQAEVQSEALDLTEGGPSIVLELERMPEQG